MAYRILLTGKNSAIIDTFFNFLWDSFELMTSSVRFEDLKRHIELVNPDIVIYCLNNEKKDDVLNVNKVRERTGHSANFFIMGSEEDCEEFVKMSKIPPNLVIDKARKIEVIKKLINNYMEDSKRADDRAEQIKAAKKDVDRKKHVLAIDDDPMMLKLIKEHLHHKYDVSIAKGGLMAYKFLEKHDTDLILLDYEMPLEDGPTVFRNIRMMDGKEEIPIVFLTGLADRERIMEVVRLKPQGYLLKPIDRVSLLEKIDQLIG